MSFPEQDDLPTINALHVHVREPCFLGCDPNFKLQVCNEVLWTLRKSSAKEIATSFFSCLWELGFRLTDDGEKRVLKIIVPKVAKFQKTYSGVQEKRARQERRSQWFTILVSPQEFSSLPWNELRSLRQESKRLVEENEQLRLDIEESARELYDQMEECQTLQQKLVELKRDGKEQQQAHRGRDYGDVSSRQQQRQRLQIK